MKTYLRFFIVFIGMVVLPFSLKAQDVIIEVPATNIFNRTELNTVKNVLNTGSNKRWRIGLFAPIDPTIRSTSGLNFQHTTITTAFMPTSILTWRLHSIGGESPKFHNQDNWPDFKWFTPNNQTWYEPKDTGSSSKYTPGNVVFNFRIPSDKYTSNVFRAGNYTLGVTHNYDSSGLYFIEFTPNNFQVILIIPAAIQWLSSTPTRYIEISNLDDYRSTSDRVLGNLGLSEIGNTLNFNLHAKAASSLIQFTSSSNAQESRNISTIRLGSASQKLKTLPLSSTLQNYSASNFVVETGNRNNFTLDLSVSATDFKAYFYQAGTYKFQLNLETKSTDNTISALQNTDVILKVLPLSEITIPNSGNAVNFEFNTNAHYQQGLSKVIPNQLKISNNETFELYVKSDATFFKKGGIQTDINSNILEIGIDGSTTVALSPTPQKIISANAPVLDQELNIKYTIPPTAAQSLVGREKTTYSINVIYSFTAL